MEAATRRRQAAIVGIVAVAASPIMVAALAVRGQAWAPLSDWASMVLRVSQVGTRETPLVGPYSWLGWAHPGPLVFWVAMPLYRLTGGDPRSLLWTAAALNVLSVAWLARVAWRRGGWPLLLATMLFTTLLVHGFGPSEMIDLWNPYIALLPFTLTVFLAWDAALGNRRAIVEAALPASFAMQSHLAYLTLTAVVAVWLWAWIRWGQAATPSSRLRRRDLILPAVLWLAPALDVVFDLHNLVRVGGVVLLGQHAPTVGTRHAFALVGTFAAPNGPWRHGPHHVLLSTPPASAAIWLLLLTVALGAGVLTAWRRRMGPELALGTLALVLLLASVPATARLTTPVGGYVAEWLRISCGLAWFAVAWIGLRLAATWAPAGATQRRAGVVMALAFCVVAAGAWSWGPGRAATLPPGDTALVADVRQALGDRLSHDLTYRVVSHGGAHYQGLFYWMTRDGYDVLTADGAKGLKWGHAHRLSAGDDYDAVITVALHRPGGSPDAYTACRADLRTEQILDHRSLSDDEQDWLATFVSRTREDPGAATAEEKDRAERLYFSDTHLGLFVGPVACGD